MQNIKFEIQENELLAVVGPIGCGKSSLLMALVNEIPFVEGDIKLNGKIFYVAQEPWIFSSTIKQNILFGKKYEKNKFAEIVNVCALKEVYF